MYESVLLSLLEKTTNLIQYFLFYRKSNCSSSSVLLILIEFFFKEPGFSPVIAPLNPRLTLFRLLQYHIIIQLDEIITTNYSLVIRNQVDICN